MQMATFTNHFGSFLFQFGVGCLLVLRSVDGVRHIQSYESVVQMDFVCVVRCSVYSIVMFK